MKLTHARLTQAGVIFDDNKVVGYVENQMLYGIDPDGYAVEIGTIEHNNEAITRLREWHDRKI